MTAAAGTAERLPLTGAAGLAAGRTAVSGKPGSEPADSGFAARLEEALNGPGDDARQGAENPPETEAAAADSPLPTTVAATNVAVSLWAPVSMVQPQSHPVQTPSTTLAPQAGPAEVLAAGPAAEVGAVGDGAPVPTSSLSGEAPSPASLANPGQAAEASVAASADQVRPAADGTKAGSAAQAVLSQPGTTMPATTVGTPGEAGETPGATTAGSTAAATAAAATAGVPAGDGTVRAGGLRQPPPSGGSQKVSEGTVVTSSTQELPSQGSPVLTGAIAVATSGSGGSANAPLVVPATAMSGPGVSPGSATPVSGLKPPTAVESSDTVARQNGPDGTQGIVPAAPPQAAPVPSAGPVAHAVAPQAAHPPLAEQLARPIFQLATGQAGTKVLTVQLAPDSLGPVTVRAHLGTDGVRIELMAATDAGRDGLRLILADLKRDLAAQGLSSSLEMSSPSGGGAAGQQQAFRGSGAAPPGTPQWRQEPVTEPASPAAAAARLSTTSLDITV